MNADTTGGTPMRNRPLLTVAAELAAIIGVLLTIVALLR